MAVSTVVYNLSVSLHVSVPSSQGRVTEKDRQLKVELTADESLSVDQVNLMLRSCLEGIL